MNVTDHSRGDGHGGPERPGDTPIPPQESRASAGPAGISLDGFKDVLALRDFKLLFWGQAVSAIGDWVGTLAFIVAAKELSPERPELAVAIVFVLRLLPSLFATPLGGVLSDRNDRKQLMISSDLARAVIIATVPFVPHIGALYLFAFVSECFSLLFLPARDASLPNLVGPDRLEPANALIMGSSFGAIPLSGPVFALLAWLGAHYPTALAGSSLFREHTWTFALIFDALTFLVSAELIRRMRVPRSDGARDRADERLFAAVGEGARYIAQRSLLRGLAFAVTVAMLGGGVLLALGVGYVHETLGGGDVEFGWLMGLFGCGMVIGFFASQAKPPGGAMWMIRIALLLMGGVLITMAVVAWMVIAYVMAVFFGAAFSVSLIVAMSTVQARTIDRFRGRVMGAVHMLVRAALSVGALGAGAIATVVPDDGLDLPWSFSADKNQVALIVAGALIAGGTTGVRGRESDAEDHA